MMSYELKIDPKRRAAGRFIGAVRKSLINAALEEKQHHALTQQKVADCLGVNRSVINRMLRGEVNLTLRSVAELAWAMGWQPHFTLKRIAKADRNNSDVELAPPYAGPALTPRSMAQSRVYNVHNTPKNYYQVDAND